MSKEGHVADKAQLRRDLRARRRALNDQQRRDQESVIVEQVRPLLRGRLGYIASYVAMADECSVAAVHDWLWQQGRVVVLPRIIGPMKDGHMTWHAVGGPEGMLVNSLGIGEPDPKAWPLVEPTAIMTVLTPGVAFTRAGQRLGQGGGFYDRFFAQVDLSPDLMSIGVAYRQQVLAELPVELHDHRMDVVISA